MLQSGKMPDAVILNVSIKCEMVFKPETALFLIFGGG